MDNFTGSQLASEIVPFFATLISLSELLSFSKQSVLQNV